MENQKPTPEASKPDAKKPEHPPIAPTAQVGPEGQDSNARWEDAPPVPDTYTIEIAPICKALNELDFKEQNLIVQRSETEAKLKWVEKALDIYLSGHQTIYEFEGTELRGREEVAAARRADVAELKTKAAEIRRVLGSVRAHKRQWLKKAAQINGAHSEPLSKYLP